MKPKKKTAKERIDDARRRYITGAITQEQLQNALRHPSITKSELFVWTVIRTIKDRDNYEQKI